MIKLNYNEFVIKVNLVKQNKQKWSQKMFCKKNLNLKTNQEKKRDKASILKR